MTNNKQLLSLAVAAAVGLPGAALATNGMNLEGYGPIATGMGGASMAYDNGTAAMMNNPATLGIVEDGNRLDVAVGSLSPDIKSVAYGQNSKATQFLMPAIGWASKSGQLTYGAGVFSQGGMGAEYNVMLPDGNAATDRSEVGVGRFMIPVAYNVNEALSVGGSIDYVWATMDLQITAPGSVLGSMVTGGTMAPNLPSMMTPTTAGRFDFSDNNDFGGKATGNGFAAKLGLTYVVSPAITVGFTYQNKTAMSNLETSGSGATATFYNVNTPGGFVASMPLKGKVAVKDFQWPTTLALGMSYKANDTLMVVADIKQIQWADVMKDFKMTFTADDASAAAMGGGTQTLDVTMPQKWDDQTVIQVGAAYKISDVLTGRIGLNHANNPVPDDTVNPLFPATVVDHYTFGLGYDVSAAQSVNFSYTYAPSVAVNGASGDIKHGQSNWQLMYSHRF